MSLTSLCRPVLWGLLLIAALAGFYRAAKQPPVAPFATPAAVSASDALHSSRGLATMFLSSRQNYRVHASSLVERSDGRILAFWYSGTREGARDVEIRSALFDPAQGRWSAERIIATREQTSRSLSRGIKKLGNPVAAQAPDGTLLLFFVTVSVGGWSGSSISVMASHDEGATWQPARRLITSPFLNVSTLVRGSSFAYRDGTIGLPVYHELFGKFGEILRLTGTGELIDKQRLSTVYHSGLQPEVLIQSARQATAFMRNAGAKPRRVLMTSQEAGREWSAVTKTNFANPNSAVAALALADGGWLLVLNDQESGREKLSLYASFDHGESWRMVHQLEDQTHARGLQPDSFVKVVEQLVGETASAGAYQADDLDVASHVETIRRAACRKGRHCRFRFSYPDLLQARNGDIHLSYTYNKAFIKHVWFSRAWLQQAWRRAHP